MTERQEMLEMFREPEEYPRFDEDNLETLFYEHDPDLEEIIVTRMVKGKEELSPIQVDTEVLPRFPDGSAMTSLTILSALRQDKKIHFRNLKTDRQFGFLDNDAYAKFTKKKKLTTDPFDPETLKKMREVFPVMKLNDTLVRHHVQRQNTFESKVKYYDVAVKLATQTLRDIGSDNFPSDEVYQEAIAEAGPIFERAVTKKKGERTESLLDDFREQYANLEGLEVWLLARTHQDLDPHRSGKSGSNLMAVQLVGFSIHGLEEEAAIEPVVRGIDGREGLLPESVYVDPGIYMRIRSDMVREKKGILSTIMRG